MDPCMEESRRVAQSLQRINPPYQRDWGRVKFHHIGRPATLDQCTLHHPEWHHYWRKLSRRTGSSELSGGEERRQLLLHQSGLQRRKRGSEEERTHHMRGRDGREEVHFHSLTRVPRKSAVLYVDKVSKDSTARECHVTWNCILYAREQLFDGPAPIPLPEKRKKMRRKCT